MLSRWHRYAWPVLGLALGVVYSLPAADYTWNSSGTDWATGSNWSPTGPPGSTDDTFFTPNGAAVGTTVQNPSVTVGQQVKSLTIAPNQNMGGWTFSGSGTLTLGGTSSTGLTTYGPATTVLDGPALLGASALAPLNFNITNGSTLSLAGNTVAVQQIGVVNINGGTLRLDNSSTASSARLADGAANTLTINAGGTFELVGNSSLAVAQTVGGLAGGTGTGADVISGVNTIKVTPNGQATTLTFANSDLSGFSTRPGTRAVYKFMAASGNFGDTSGAKITFVGTPFLGANSLLATTSGGANFGYAIATDAGGTDFATWSLTSGITRAGASQTASTVSAITSTDNSTRIFYTPSANDSASGSLTVGSLRITPSSSGLTLAMGSSNLTTSALMLNGTNSFTISGSGSLGASTTRYIYVNDSSTTLSTSLKVADGSNQTVFAGPGFVELTSSSSQNSLNSAVRFVIAGGTVRGNNTQIGFTSSGAGVISLTGGVLEIKGGANGTGSAADFTRALGTSAGQVTWGAGTSNEIGSGGFSAFGSAASVNIGGNATPDSLRWGQTNFVADGFALKFGSTKSDATLTFLNPIQLDAAGGGSYQLREIQVTSGAGGDSTVLAGVISGAATADLIKTGSGTLTLSGVNTYSGNTLVSQGTLLLANTSSGSATGTGSVNVFSGATLGGNNAGSVTATITVASGGTIAPGLGGTNTGILSVTNLTFQSGSAFNINANGSTAGTGYDQLMTSSGTIILDGTLTATFDDGYAPTSNDRLFIVNNTGTGDLTGTFSNYTNGSIVTTHGGFDWRIYYGASANVWGGTDGNDVVLVPVPEPTHLLLICGAAGGLGGAIRRVWERRRRAGNLCGQSARSP